MARRLEDIVVARRKAHVPRAVVAHSPAGGRSREVQVYGGEGQVVRAVPAPPNTVSLWIGKVQASTGSREMFGGVGT